MKKTIRKTVSAILVLTVLLSTLFSIGAFAAGDDDSVYVTYDPYYEGRDYGEELDYYFDCGYIGDETNHGGDGIFCFLQRYTVPDDGYYKIGFGRSQYDYNYEYEWFALAENFEGNTASGVKNFAFSDICNNNYYYLNAGDTEYIFAELGADNYTAKLSVEYCGEISSLIMKDASMPHMYNYDCYDSDEYFGKWIGGDFTVIFDSSATADLCFVDVTDDTEFNNGSCTFTAVLGDYEQELTTTVFRLEEYVKEIKFENADSIVPEINFTGTITNHEELETERIICVLNDGTVLNSRYNVNEDIYFVLPNGYKMYVQPEFYYDYESGNVMAGVYYVGQYSECYLEPVYCGIINNIKVLFSELLYALRWSDFEYARNTIKDFIDYLF